MKQCPVREGQWRCIEGKCEWWVQRNAVSGVSGCVVKDIGVSLASIAYDVRPKLKE